MIASTMNPDQSDLSPYCFQYKLFKKIVVPLFGAAYYPAPIKAQQCETDLGLYQQF